MVTSLTAHVSAMMCLGSYLNEQLIYVLTSDLDLNKRDLTYAPFILSYSSNVDAEYY
jgi:hypothetical protein